MDTRYTVGVNEYRRMTTQELRDAFLIDLFEAGAINLIYCEAERAIVGVIIGEMFLQIVGLGGVITQGSSDLLPARMLVAVVVIATMGTIIVTAMLVFFVPKFEPIFERMSSRGELPWATTALIRGAMDTSQLRNDGYDFLNLGFHLERADNTARLWETASGNHVLSFENLSSLSAKMQDVLCTVSTGGGTASRQFYLIELGVERGKVQLHRTFSERKLAAEFDV